MLSALAALVMFVPPGAITSSEATLTGTAGRTLMSTWAWAEVANRPLTMAAARIFLFMDMVFGTPKLRKK